MRSANVRIEPFEFLDVIAFEGFKKENEHARIRFSGYIRSRMEELYLGMALETLWASVWAVGRSGEETLLLNGVVTDLSISSKNDVKLLTVELGSGSYLMDTLPQTRSFFAPKLSYRELLSFFTASYPQGSCIFSENCEELLSEPVLQYRETDWAFARRLASHFHTVLFPDCKARGASYFFGLPAPGEPAQINTKLYSVQKSLSEYSWKKKHKVPGIRERDAIYYIVKCKEIYELGQRVRLNSHNLYVSAAATCLEGGELCHVYYLKTENGSRVPELHIQKAAEFVPDAGFSGLRADGGEPLLQAGWGLQNPLFPAPDSRRKVQAYGSVIL